MSSMGGSAIGEGLRTGILGERKGIGESSTSEVLKSSRLEAMLTCGEAASMVVTVESSDTPVMGRADGEGVLLDRRSCSCLEVLEKFARSAFIMAMVVGMMPAVLELSSRGRVTLGIDEPDA